MSLTRPQVSVIMSAYNAAEHIGRAIKSIQNQTLDDIEILVIDDGSTDRTVEIVSRLAERDIRIEVIQAQHRGIAESRNVGMSYARGKYVSFCDADDWIEPAQLQEMVQAAEADNLDLVIGSFYVDTWYDGRDRQLTEIRSCPSKVYLHQQDFRCNAWQLFENKLFNSACNKLFVRNIINDYDLSFKAHNFDDKPFLLSYIRDVQRVAVLEKPMYHYQKYPDKEDTIRWSPGLFERREQEHEELLDLYNHWNLDNDAKTYEMVQTHYFKNLVSCIENVCNPKCVLGVDEKRRLIEKMITSERAQKSASIACPKNRMLQMLLGPIRKKNVSLVYSEGRFISFIKRRNNKIFTSFTANK